ncbi:hypothetical protein KBP53_03545 [Corynebacterium genitalium ATCC 33030]|nr:MULTISPECIES: hypothetical protein [Corynebacterium]MCQ4619843.1 hypothetical protein [Corynebacterium sp. CCUG 71335]MCQ4623403.1 hypothetical protein [Corynebacterium sp. CCUG 70398]UUA90041.1 hypothetical protein KBP53_03545 [Corynebacterium genitalium ATCC 33030]
MSNEYWGAPHNQYQPGMYPPQYPPVTQQKSSNAGMIIMSVIAGLLAIALTGFLVYYFTTNSDANRAANEPALTSVQQPSEGDRPTVTQTVNAPSPNEQQQPKPANKPTKNYTDYWVNDSDVTTPQFAANVFSAFVAKYNSTGSPNVTLYGVYSPVTGKNYDMTCRDQGAHVACTGGNNAAVYIS